MKKFKLLKTVTAAALTLTGLLGLTATNEVHAQTGENQEIVFWHGMGGNAGNALEALVEQFNEENELGITVTSEYQGSYDDTITKLRNSSLGNLEADLVQIYDIGTRYMIDSGLVTPMQTFIDAEGYDLSQIEPNIAAYYTVNDELISMPFNSSTPILYYNVDLFEAAGIENAPTTLAEIIEIQPALEEAGATMPISLQVYGWFVEQFIAKEGDHFVNNGNGREDYTTEVAFIESGVMEEVLTAWYDLFEANAAPNVGRQGGQPEFVSGQSAMTMGSTASLAGILAEVDGKFEVGTAFLPAVTEDGLEGGVSIGGASVWALDSQDPEKAQATWEFVKFLVSPSVQAEWAAATGYFPISTAAHDEAVFQENVANFPQFQTAIDQLHASSPESQGALVSVFPEARQIVETEIENMLNGNLTPAEAAQAMADQINTAIEQYNLVNY